MPDVGLARPVGDTESDVANHHVVPGHARHPELMPVGDGRARTGFDQQPGSERRAPGDLIQPIRIKSVRITFLLRVGGSGRSAVASLLGIQGHVELMLRRYLPGEPQEG